MIDTYRDAFHQFVKVGMSYAEAYDHFDEGKLKAAMEEELERGRETLFDLCVKAQFEQRNQKDFDEIVR